MWQKDFSSLADGYGEVVMGKLRTLWYAAVCALLFSILKSDKPPHNYIKKQDIPTIQPTQYRYHDGFILPPLSHDE